MVRVRELDTASGCGRPSWSETSCAVSHRAIVLRSGMGYPPGFRVTFCRHCRDFLEQDLRVEPNPSGRVMAANNGA